MPGTEMQSLQEILCEGEEVKAFWHQKKNLFKIIYLKYDILYRRSSERMDQMLLPKRVGKKF